MMKKVLAVLVCALLTLSFFGCSEGGGSDKNNEDVKTPYEKESVPVDVFDENGNSIGKIGSGASCTIFDNGIFYKTAIYYDKTMNTGIGYYHFLSFTGEDKLMGTLPDEGYEAEFCRTELGGIIYTLAVVGNVADVTPDELVLLAFDTSAGTMAKYTVSRYGYPYVDIAAANGRIYIMNHEQVKPQKSAVYEFDPGTSTIKEVISCESTDTAVQSLRGVCPDGEGIAVLRLRIEGSSTMLFLDRYDASFTKLSEQDVSSYIFKACADSLTADDAKAEPQMLTSEFQLIDGRYMIYENFSIVRAVFDLQEDKVLAAETDLYSFSQGDGQALLYRFDFGTPSKAEEFNIVTLSDGEMKKVSTGMTNPPDMLRNLTVSKSGKMLLRCVSTKGGQTMYIKELKIG